MALPKHLAIHLNIKEFHKHLFKTNIYSGAPQMKYNLVRLKFTRPRWNQKYRRQATL